MARESKVTWIPSFTESSLSHEPEPEFIEYYCASMYRNWHRQGFILRAFHPVWNFPRFWLWKLLFESHFLVQVAFSRSWLLFFTLCSSEKDRMIMAKFVFILVGQFWKKLRRKKLQKFKSAWFCEFLISEIKLRGLLSFCVYPDETKDWLGPFHRLCMPLSKVFRRAIFNNHIFK